MADPTAPKLKLALRLSCTMVEWGSRDLSPRVALCSKIESTIAYLAFLLFPVVGLRPSVPLCSNHFRHGAIIAGMSSPSAPVWSLELFVFPHFPLTSTSNLQNLNLNVFPEVCLKEDKTPSFSNQSGALYSSKYWTLDPCDKDSSQPRLLAWFKI